MWSFLSMVDDPVYDHLAVRSGGSLLVEEMQESVSNEFFRTHDPLHEMIRISASGYTAGEAAELEVQQTVKSETEQISSVTPTPPITHEIGALSQTVKATVHESVDTESQPLVQDENLHHGPIENKPAENLEDLSRLAMFGKQRTVLRRSQIKPTPDAGAIAPSPANHTSSSRRSAQRGTPTRGIPQVSAAGAQPATRRADPAFAARARLTPSSIKEKKSAPIRPAASTGGYKTGPVRVISESRQPVVHPVAAPIESISTKTGSTARQRYLPSGPLTRARSKELGISFESETNTKAGKAPSDPVASLAVGVRQMKVGTERLARDRAPRTNTSSASAASSQRSHPVRIAQGSRAGDSFLRNTAVPTEREFRRELVTRNSSLGPSSRGLSSTPKDDGKTPLPVAATHANRGQEITKSSRPVVARVSCSADPPIRRPTVRPPSMTRPIHAPNVAQPPCVTRPASAPRASSVTRPSTVMRPASRPPSVTRPAQQPPSVTRPVQRPPSVTRPAQRPPSVTRPAHRPPSVTRPHIPDTSSTIRTSSRTCATSGSTRTTSVRAPVSITSTARSTITAKSTPSRGSVGPNKDLRPLEPRSSVIRCSPVAPRGAGNGTPLRGFRAELRKYPAPTGLTPIHRAPTVPKGFDIGEECSHAKTSIKAGSVASSVGQSSVKILSKEEERALVARLTIPKKSAPATPKVSNLRTHGLSCVKVRSRSISVSRRPTSALSCGDAPTSSRMLTFSDADRPTSAEPTAQSEQITAQDTITIE